MILNKEANFQAHKTCVDPEKVYIYHRLGTKAKNSMRKGGEGIEYKAMIYAMKHV